MAKNAFKLYTMVRENFEIHLFQMVKNAFKLSMVGENFKFYLSEMDSNTFFIMVGENVAICNSAMARNVSKVSTILEKILKFTHL